MNRLLGGWSGEACWRWRAQELDMISCLCGVLPCSFIAGRLFFHNFSSLGQHPLYPSFFPVTLLLPPTLPLFLLILKIFIALRFRSISLFKHITPFQDEIKHTTENMFLFFFSVDFLSVEDDKLSGIELKYSVVWGDIALYDAL